MLKLAELKVYGLNEHWVDQKTKEDGLDLMRILYRNSLNTDPLWHFFWEGDYTVIRCSPMIASEIDETLSHYDDFTVVWAKNGYDENIKITAKYLPAFVQIFHGFSILAMEMENEDFLRVFERINHCFLNMVTREELRNMFKIHDDYDDLNKNMAWEAIAISQVAFMRMFTHGWLTGLFNRKKGKDG